MVGKLQLIENSFQRLLHSELRSIQKEASRGMTGFLMFICLGNGLTENIKSKFLRTVCGPKLIQMAKLIGNRIGHFRYPSSLDHEENVDGVGFTICAQMLNNFIYCLMQNICVSFIYTGMSFQKQNEKRQSELQIQYEHIMCDTVAERLTLVKRLIEADRPVGLERIWVLH